MSDYLSEEEQVARLKSWWDEYGTSVLIAVAVSVAGIVGWRWYDGHSQDQVYAASSMYEEYTQATQDTGRSEHLAKLSADHPGSAYHVLATFDQVKRNVEAGDAAAGLALLQDVVTVADDALLRDLARIRLAKLQRELDQTEAALATLGAIRNEGYRAYALEVKGDIHAARNEVELAHETYQAARDSLSEAEQRPILDMKLKNTAPFAGQFVQLSDPLERALQSAQETLSTSDVDGGATDGEGTDSLDEPVAEQSGEQAGEQDTQSVTGEPKEELQEALQEALKEETND